MAGAIIATARDDIAIREPRLVVVGDSACDSISKAATGTLSVAAIARVDPFKSSDSIPRLFASLVVEAIAAHLVLPKPLEFPVYNSTDITMALTAPSAGNKVYPSFTSEFLLTLRKDGSAKKVEMTQTSLMPQLDDAIASAIHAADSAHDFPPLDGVTTASSMPFFVDFDMGSGVFTTGFPVFRASVPLFRATSVQPDVLVSPKYPEELRTRGKQGEARVRFVVDETGRVAKGSHRFLKLSEVPFGQSVIDAFPRMRFKPARIGNCPIKQIVEQTFQFKLGSRLIIGQ